jgi:hypothetical protein
VLAGVGLAFTDIAWSIGTHAEAHALHLALVAILLRLLVAWEDALRGPASMVTAMDAPPHAPADTGADTGAAGAGAGTRRADRLLVAAAVVGGLALGNHSLTLLLAPGIAVYVLAVDPGIWRRPRLIVTCGLATLVTVALVFLELPLRAGPLRAPLVYGHPETWDGFWYIVLAEQFRGSLVAPFSDLTVKFGELVARTGASFGPVAALIPFGFLATVWLRPRYALLTGLIVAITCFFAASYVNADIGRYYLVPALIAWTWLAMLLAVPVRALAGDMPGRGRNAGTGDAEARVRDSGIARWPRLAVAVAIGLAVVLLVPTALDIGERARRVDRSHDLIARSWLDGTLEVLEPNAVVVSWWSYSTPLWYAQHVEGRRPDVTIIDDRTRLDEDLGDIYAVIDANLPTRPVYVIRADPREVAGLAARYELEPIGGPDARFLTRVVRPREGGG